MKFPHQLFFSEDCILGRRNRQISERCDYFSTIANFCEYRLVIWNNSPTQKVWMSYICLKKLKVPEKLNNIPLFPRNATTQPRPSIFSQVGWTCHWRKIIRTDQFNRIQIWEHIPPIPVGRLGFLYKIYFKRMQYRPVLAWVNPDMWICPFFMRKTGIFERTVSVWQAYPFLDMFLIFISDPLF